MAWNKITAPTGGAPLADDDYDAQNQHIIGLLAQMGRGICHLTEWATLTQPQIADGVYVYHGGSLYLNSGAQAITVPGGLANGRVYIAISDPGTGVLDVEFTNSAAGYSWNYAYQGFYNAGGDQLIPYVLYKTASGYHKYTLDKLSDRHNITSKLIIIETEISIGAWNMDGSDSITVVMSDIVQQINSVSDQLIKQTIYCNVYLRNDADTIRMLSLEEGDSTTGTGSISFQSAVSATSYYLRRTIGGVFDAVAWDDAVIIRGYLSHCYWI